MANSMIQIPIVGTAYMFADLRKKYGCTKRANGSILPTKKLTHDGNNFVIFDGGIVKREGTKHASQVTKYIPCTNDDYGIGMLYTKCKHHKKKK